MTLEQYGQRLYSSTSQACSGRDTSCRSDLAFTSFATILSKLSLDDLKTTIEGKVEYGIGQLLYEIIDSPSYISVPYVGAKIHAFLEVLPQLRRAYDDMPGATISPRCVNSTLVSSNWLSALRHGNYPRSSLMAAIVMLDTGCLDIGPESFHKVFAISSGSLLYVAAPLLSDPTTFSSHHQDGIRVIVGNVGRPGITLLVAPHLPEVRVADPEKWKLVNHAEFDGRLEDAFQGTSLHLRFTGSNVPFYRGSNSSRFTETSYAEAVVAVHEHGKWVADVDILDPIRSIKCLSPDEACKGCSDTVSSDFTCTAIENWEEILDPPQSGLNALAVFKTHGNWQARLAAFAICARLGHEILLSHEHACWNCILKNMAEWRGACEKKSEESIQVGTLAEQDMNEAKLGSGENSEDESGIDSEDETKSMGSQIQGAPRGAQGRGFVVIL